MLPPMNPEQRVNSAEYVSGGLQNSLLQLDVPLFDLFVVVCIRPREEKSSDRKLAVRNIFRRTENMNRPFELGLVRQSFSLAIVVSAFVGMGAHV